MKLKIGRHEYEITNNDKFMDNEACVQLLTQSKEKKHNIFDRANPCPKLSKKAIREIEKFTKIHVKHDCASRIRCIVFSLDVDGDGVET